MIVSPALFLCVLEAGLRLGGYGHRTSFFIGPDAVGDYLPNPKFGWRFFPRPLARLPVPCFMSAKAPGAVRIFVLGSSAAQGVPDPSFSFGRILEVMLRKRYPGVPFEVVNAAMTAINSHVVLQIARDCATYEPDLFVVYTGNNEVVGPYGPATVFQRWSPSRTMIRANAWAKSMRTGQLLDSFLERLGARGNSPSAWRGMQMFTGNCVAADDPRLEAVYENFRQNLSDVCQVARRAGAGVILSTVAVNLKDCPPFSSLHRSGLSAEQLAEWKSIYEAGIKLEGEKRWLEAIAKYEAAAQIDDHFAELPYRRGRCLLAAGRVVEARGQYVLARDLDALRFRADSRLNAIIREVGSEQGGTGVRLADAEQSLAKGASGASGLCGEESFYEHVHLKFDGNYLLARTVLEEVEAALPRLTAFARKGPIPSRRQCAESLALTAWDEWNVAQPMVSMTARAPFTEQLEHAARQALAEETMKELGRRASTRAVVAEARRIYETALEAAGDDWRLHFRFGLLLVANGYRDLAVPHFQIIWKRPPLDPLVCNDAGDVATDTGHVAEAISCLQKAIELDPSFAAAHNNLGRALAKSGRMAEALVEYRKALQLDPTMVMAHNNLAFSLESGGNVAEAIAEYEKALEIDPSSAIIHFNLAKTFLNQGRIEEAIAHFGKAVEIEPNYAAAHNNLGAALYRNKQVDEAIAHFRKALEIMPDYAQARANLAHAMRARANNSGKSRAD
jgi:tetratricopeptide (TPR) repeat protein